MVSQQGKTKGLFRFVGPLLGILLVAFLASLIFRPKALPVDLAEVREMPGVVGAFAAEDLAAMGIDYVMRGEIVGNRDGCGRI